ncbi:MAG: 50S ribosomal protein L19 [Planctomycetes bacterium]|nr:50S ribosomal protein L19 [Planctomycetota bacterium]
MTDKMHQFERKQLRRKIPEFNVGDNVDVHVRIVEGEKQRIQIFAGTVIARKGSANRESFTVRRIVAGEGVERIFMLHSPWIEDIKVRRPGKVRRAKLYYLRERVGKATKVRERMSFEKTHGRKRKDEEADEEVPAAAQAESDAEAEPAAERR